MITTMIPTLKVHKLTREQYDRELAAGRLDEAAFYLTPEEDFATKEYVAYAIETAIGAAIGGSY